MVLGGANVPRSVGAPKENNQGSGRAKPHWETKVGEKKIKMTLDKALYSYQW